MTLPSSFIDDKTSAVALDEIYICYSAERAGGNVKRVQLNAAVGIASRTGNATTCGERDAGAVPA